MNQTFNSFSWNSINDKDQKCIFTILCNEYVSMTNACVMCIYDKHIGLF